jgi:hypothetical protein
MRASRGIGRVITAGTLAVAAATIGAAGDVVTVVLQATPRNAGQIGRAFLIAQGSQTRVQVEVSGVPPQVSSRPVHLYTFIYEGTCYQRSAQPAFSLLGRVLAQSPASSGIVPAGGPFTISNTAPVPLEKLRREAHAIVVTTSPADGSVEIFCGAVG